MMHDPFDLTTIIFALLAIFVVWKLRSVLGERNGNEPEAPENFTDFANPPASNVLRLPEPGKTADNDAGWADFADPGSKVWSGLDAIRAADPRFDPRAFLEGAAKAHEIVLQAYAARDTKTLKNLLGPDVFANFSQALAGMEQRGEKVETTLVAQDKSTIENAEVDGAITRITVRFRVKMITFTRDSSGAIIDGNAEQVADVQDVWTFARETRSRDPNWKLVAILDV